jgi:hypothetical protein
VIIRYFLLCGAVLERAETAVVASTGGDLTCVWQKQCWGTYAGWKEASHLVYGPDTHTLFLPSFGLRRALSCTTEYESTSFLHDALSPRQAHADE